MKILLDNCVDVHAKTLFPDHQVQHVLDLGWEAMSNGKLLAAAAEAHFDVMVTVTRTSAINRISTNFRCPSLSWMY